MLPDGFRKSSCTRCKDIDHVISRGYFYNNKKKNVKIYVVVLQSKDMLTCKVG